MAVAVWDSLDNIAAYATEVALLDRMAGARAANALRAPFGLGSRDDLVALFEGAEVPSVAITTHTGTARFPSVAAMLEADLRGWLPVVGVVLSEAQIQSILAEAENALAPYVTGKGNIEFAVSAHVVMGSKP